MFAKSVLVTGCDKGIGLEFVKQLATQTQNLFAGCLAPNEANEVKKITETYKNVVMLPLDVTNEEIIETAVNRIADVVGKEGLNCIINNAGVLHFMNTIENLTVESLQTTYEVNAIGPAMVAKACIPLLRKASNKASNKVSRNHMSVSLAAILNISSTAGTMENIRGEKLFYSYRNSKRALNMLTKNLGIELNSDNILVTNIIPGWVQTDMGGADASMTTCESVHSMIEVMLNLNENNTGLLYKWNGDALDW